MIEPTDEMERAYEDAAWENPVELGGLEMANVRAGLVAVLAIVERDYGIVCPSMADVFNGWVRCAKAPGHHGGHLGVSPSAALIW